VDPCELDPPVADEPELEELLLPQAPSSSAAASDTRILGQSFIARKR
jgi:hypothetical protein